jgi:hypothetical protein
MGIQYNDIIVVIVYIQKCSKHLLPLSIILISDIEKPIIFVIKE